MPDLIPTMQLRFVERPKYPRTPSPETVKVLQQRFVFPHADESFWLDVPFVADEREL